MESCQLNTPQKLYYRLKNKLLVAAKQLVQSAQILRCIGCGEEANQSFRLCYRCTQSIPLIGNCCRTCAKPTPANQPLCGMCTTNPPLFEKVFVQYQFKQPMSEWVSKFKFSGSLAMGRVLADLLVAHLLQSGFPKNASVIAVPLHAKRLRQRGYNQSGFIAKRLCKKLGLENQSNCLVRIKDNAHQVGASKTQRERNVKNAFACVGTINDTVIIVDDVMTTGATANAVALELQKHGVTKIYLALVARAV